MRSDAIKFATLAVWLTCGGVSAQSEAPLSVIDWLDQQPNAEARPAEKPVALRAETPDVAVEALRGPDQRLVGLVPGTVTGLPADLWQGSDRRAVLQRLEQVRAPRLPAAQALLYSILLTEAYAPADDAGQFDLARVDVLTRLGALDPAIALIRAADPKRSPAHFARFRDLKLIAGRPEEMCQSLREAPALSDDLALEVFCQARLGEYETAVLLFGAGAAVDRIDADKADALVRFLDPGLFEGEPPLDFPSAPDPLLFALFEAEGERLPTRSWPRIYANADLDPRAGWKAQLEAAERLAATGALPENRLLGLYTERKPAASGGIWDRVTAIQRLDQALRAGSPAAVEKTLPAAWASARTAHLERAFATLFGAQLRALDLDAATRSLAFEMTLFSQAYEEAATVYPDIAEARGLLVALASGNLKGQQSRAPLERALIDAFTATPADAGILRLARAGELGLALLDTLAMLEDGAAGDTGRLTLAIATMRSLGLEDAARQAALQVLLLEGQG